MTEFKASSKQPQQKQEEEVEPEDEAEQQDFAAIVRGRTQPAQALELKNPTIILGNRKAEAMTGAKNIVVKVAGKLEYKAMERKNNCVNVVRARYLTQLLFAIQVCRADAYP
jgi:hypothetical protein